MSKEETNWFESVLDIGKIIAGPTPLGAVLHVVDAITDEANKETGVNDDDVLETLSSMMKSKWNSLTPAKIEKIKDILNDDEIVVRS